MPTLAPRARGHFGLAVKLRPGCTEGVLEPSGMAKRGEPDAEGGATGGEPGEAAPSAPPARPTHAERCRTLLASAASATLATIARDPSGYPHASLVAVADDDAGRPLFFLSALAEHTQNLRERAEASILIAEPSEGAPSRDPLALGRATLLGPCRRLEGGAADEARRAFVARHPSAERYASFADFAPYRLEPVAIRFVGGFGRMSWVDPAAYLAAAPDPLAHAAAGILRHMNADHADAVLAYARALAGIADAQAATMTAVDRLGFDLEAETPEGPRAARLAFDAPVTTPGEARGALVALARTARELARGR